MASTVAVVPRVRPAPGVRKQTYEAVEYALNRTFPAVLRSQSWSPFDYLRIDFDASEWLKTSLVFHLAREIPGEGLDNLALSVHGPTKTPVELDWAVTVADGLYRARVNDRTGIYAAGYTRVFTLDGPESAEHLRSEVKCLTAPRRPALPDCHYFAYIGVVCHRGEKTQSLLGLVTDELDAFNEHVQNDHVQVVVGYPWLRRTNKELRKDWNRFAMLQLVYSSPAGEVDWMPMKSPEQHSLW